MKRASCRVFPPKGGSLLQAIPGQQNGVQQLNVDVQGACEFMTKLGPENVIGVAPAGPVLTVFYWVDVPDPAQNEQGG